MFWKWTVWLGENTYGVQADPLPPTAPSLSWGGGIVRFQSGASLLHMVAIWGAPQKEMKTQGELGTSTVAFRTHLQLLCLALRMLCFPLVRKTIHLSPFFLSPPCCVGLPTRIKKLALSQLGKTFKIKCVHLGVGVGVTSWSPFSRWPLNISGAGFIFVCHPPRGSNWKWWGENPFV